MANKNLATEMAPPFILVAHYFIAGAFFYILTSIALPFFSNEINSFFLSPSLGAILHLYLLGFVMMIIFGAMYQLVPVVLEIPIFSKDFAYIQFYMYIVGIVIFVLSLYFEECRVLMPYGAMLIYISMVIFTFNIFLTYKNLQEWTIVAKFILVSNIFLLIAATIGFFMALNLIYGFYSGDIISLVVVHIAGAIGGYVLMTIMGVGMVLLPMFGLSHGFNEKPINYAFYAITVGLTLFMIFSIADIPLLKYMGLFLISISIFLTLYQMWIIFTTRVRKINDYWTKNMVASFILLIVALFLVAISFFIQKESILILFGFVLFFGFLVFFIVGHIYKILPFLVWYQRFSPLVGKQKVPMLNEMISEKVAEYQFWTTLFGTLLASVAIIFEMSSLFFIGTLFMGIGAIFVLYNIYYTLTY